MSINDLLDADLLPAIVICFIVAILVAPIGIAAGKKANKDIYGDDNYSSIRVEKNVKIVARRTMPHPCSQTIMVNMVVFELTNNCRLELAIRDSNIYGTMVEGDCGTLKYQGKKFIAFERNVGNEN